MNTTKIEWTDLTVNPISGCSPLSEGCQNCYAARMAKRLAGRFGYDKTDPFRVTFHPGQIEKVLKIKKPKKIFVCSMGDLFHPDVPFDWVRQVTDVMAQSPQHTYQILTKRPERMREYWEESGWTDADEWPNVWLGVTAENQKTADERIPVLVDIPAAVRFVSAEPMLEKINLEGLFGEWCDYKYACDEGGGDLGGYPASCPPGCEGCTPSPTRYEPGLDWVIVGAETGPGVRPMNPDWARDVRDQCTATGTPFFFKKMSGGADIPDDLMIREFPKGVE